MDKRKWTAFIIVFAVALIAIVVTLYLGVSYSPGASPSGDAGAQGTVATRGPAPAAVAVPGENASNTPKNIAVPDIVAPALPGSSAQYREFAITIKNNAFTPNTVIVRSGDQISIDLTAADANYDFTQPDYFGSHPIPIPKGTTKTVSFEASAAGKFTFYCASCGGPAKGPVGYIEVVSQ